MKRSLIIALILVAAPGSDGFITPARDRVAAASQKFQLANRLTGQHRREFRGTGAVCLMVGTNLSLGSTTAGAVSSVFYNAAKPVECALGPQRRTSQNRRVTGSNRNPLSRNYKGLVVTVNSVEVGDSFDDGLRTWEPRDADDEMIRINITVKSRGNDAYVEFTSFKLIGVDGTVGETGFSRVMMSVYKDRPENSKDIFFAIRKGTRLKTLHLDDLSFDLTKIKVKKQE